jgi:hypothetical protein
MEIIAVTILIVLIMLTYSSGVSFPYYPKKPITLIAEEPNIYMHPYMLEAAKSYPLLNLSIQSWPAEAMKVIL